jgi:hypothetical protein
MPLLLLIVVLAGLGAVGLDIEAVPNKRLMLLPWLVLGSTSPRRHA